MSKFATLAAGLVAIPILAFAAPALADVSNGQIMQGDIYRVKNVTSNGSFADNITAACGDTVAFRVRVQNLGPNTINNVKVAATLDSGTSTSHSSQVSLTADNVYNNGPVTAQAGLTTSQASTINYVNGSTELLDTNGNKLNNLPDGVVSASGINIGSIGPLTSTAEEVQFEAQINCPTTPPAPVFTCNLLSLTEPATKQVQASVQYTAQNGATFNNVTFNFGDNSTPLTTADTTANHTYANFGTYTVTATVSFNVNGSSQSVTNSNCAKSVSFTATTTPSTPTTPTQLVNTGPGSVAGIFGGVTVLGAVAHRLFGRRLARLFVR